MQQLILMIILLDIFFFGVSFYYLRKDRRYLKKETLLKKFSQEDAVVKQRKKLMKNGKQRSGIGRVLEKFVNLEGLDMLLISADVPISLERFIFLSLGAALLFLLPVLLLFRNPVMMAAVMAAGFFLPFLYLIYRKKRREETLVRQLPDALAMIVRSLRVGQSVDASLREAGHSLPPPVSTEIVTIYEEMAMGMPFEKAMRNFERRFNRVADIKILCTSFIIQRETGGNLGMILEDLADTIRQRFKLKRQVKTLTAEGRISALILGFLPLFFAAATWIFNPDYISVLFDRSIGQKLLFAAVTLEVVGFIVMRLMSRIEA